MAKFITAKEAAQLIPDGAVVGLAAGPTARPCEFHAPA